METFVESERPSQPDGGPSLSLQLLGPLTIRRGDVVIALPASRKVQALLGYLVLAPHPVPRSRLCDLLWDVPNDPRGELRWCLSKIRSLVDDPGQRRVDTQADTIAMHLDDCSVDVIAVARAQQEGIDTLSPERLRELAPSFTGEFLDGLEIDRAPAFAAWLAAQRRRFRSCHVAVLEQLVRDASDDHILELLEKWVELAPFDRRVHEQLLAALVRRGQIREGEEHLATSARLFEAEGLDSAPLHDAWLAAKARRNPAPSVQTSTSLPPAAEAPGTTSVTAAHRRASIAVMPFVDRSQHTGTRGGAADALADDVITRLAKLRSLFVIAQGTVFALHDRSMAPNEAGRTLNVDFVVSGSIRRRGADLTVMVELAETRTARIVWAEMFHHKLDKTFFVLDEIGNRIVASIASEIETVERDRAILKPPNSLDAWEAHHRGLWHMYRFNRHDNEQARLFFQKAVELDPAFSRAYAGLSFAHFQNAFQGWSNRGPEIDRAFEAAGRSLMVDDRDPAAHWAMGRALWLRGRHDQSLVELAQAVELSPNFAQGHYTLAFVNSQAGDPNAAIASADHSRHLSPFDPLLFAMLGARAMALARLGRFDEAAEWGIRAAARPNAHAQILAIAAYSLALAGRLEEARSYMANLRLTSPHYTIDDFLTAMHFGPESEQMFRQAAGRIE